MIMVLAVALLSSCSGATEPTVTSTSQPPATTSDAAGAPALDIPGLPELPAEARAGNGLAAPRPAGYWALWNTCAPENRAAEAEANGGRAAGFTLIDDLLLDPGIGLGDYRIDSCEDALAILEAGESAPSGSIERLAAQLLVAELNLLVAPPPRRPPWAHTSCFPKRDTWGRANWERRPPARPARPCPASSRSWKHTTPGISAIDLSSCPGSGAGGVASLLGLESPRLSERHAHDAGEVYESGSIGEAEGTAG